VIRASVVAAFGAGMLVAPQAWWAFGQPVSF
jgi:hypothetical protein